MRLVVIDQFIPFNIPKEGRVRHLYTDIIGLPTVGVGNLANPMSVALAMPFLHGDGSPASTSEIAAEWQIVNAQNCGSYATPKSCTWVLSNGKPDPSRPCLAHLGHRMAERFTKLSLTEFEIGKLCAAKMKEMWTHLLRYIPDAGGWCSDAQMGLLSMSWAMGPNFLATYPSFLSAARRNDFAGCAAECKMREDNNPGVIARNVANKILFTNASWVAKHDIDAETLYYPRVLTQLDRPKDPGIDLHLNGEITIEMSPVPLLGDTLTPDEYRGFYESDGGFARRQMMSEVVTNIALEEITKRSTGD